MFKRVLAGALETLEKPQAGRRASLASRLETSSSGKAGGAGSHMRAAACSSASCRPCTLRRKHTWQPCGTDEQGPFFTWGPRCTNGLQLHGTEVLAASGKLHTLAQSGSGAGRSEGPKRGEKRLQSRRLHAFVEQVQLTASAQATLIAPHSGRHATLCMTAQQAVKACRTQKALPLSALQQSDPLSVNGHREVGPCAGGIRRTSGLLSTGCRV